MRPAAHPCIIINVLASLRGGTRHVLSWDESKLSQFQADPTAGMTAKGTIALVLTS
jgi:hypothetical protein